MANKFGWSSVNDNLASGRRPDPGVSSAIEKVNQKLIYGRVTDIVLNNDHPDFIPRGGWPSIGSITFDNIELASEDAAAINVAYPLIPYMKNYPVVNEFVLLFLLPTKDVNQQTNITQYYYISPISIWNNQHINAYPNTENKSDVQSTEKKSYQAIEEGQTRKSTEEQVDYSYNPSTGGTFQVRSDIQPLFPFAGDIILEGRWGNSLRLGSTATNIPAGSLMNNDWSNSGDNGDAITILRNGQAPNTGLSGFVPVVEDVNKDLSSIYLTSYQQIPLVTDIKNNPSISSLPLQEVSTYNNSQIILSSNRLVFNAKNDGIILNSKKAISLQTDGPIGLYSKKSDIVLQSAQNNIRLGSSDASQPIIKGDVFFTDFAVLIKKLYELCNKLEGEPELKLSIPAASALKLQANKILDNINSYKSKNVKTI